MAICITSHMQIRNSRQEHVTMQTFTCSLSEAICLTRLMICSSIDCQHLGNHNHKSKVRLKLIMFCHFLLHTLPNLSSQKT